MSAFFILPARTKKSLMNIFADHPPLEQRLAALERLESQLQGGAPPRPWACATSSPGRHYGRRPRARPPVRDLHRLHRAAVRTLDRPLGRRRDRLPGAGDERVRNDAARNGRSRQGHRRRLRHDASPPRTTPRLPLDGAAQPCRRALGRRPRRRASTPSPARSRPPATASGCCAQCSRSRDAQKRPVYFIYNYKRGFWYPFVPGRPGERQRSARPSASCS